jgi:hypothetical protein
MRMSRRIVAAAVPAAFLIGLLAGAPTAAAAPSGPSASVSHYLRNLSTDDTANIAIMQNLAVQDAATNSADIVLDIGAQTIHDPLDAAHPGVVFTATSVRISYASLVRALSNYAVAYDQATSSRALTLAIATNSDGNFANYLAADKGNDWATQVVQAVRDSIRAQGTYSVDVVGAIDAEAGFAASLDDVKAWEAAYLSHGFPLVFIGSADGCPTSRDVTHRACATVIDDNDVSKTWTQDDYFGLTHSASSLSVLPQVFLAVQATQWANITATGTTTPAGSPNGERAIRFDGVLTENAACKAKSSGCKSMSPDRAWKVFDRELTAVGVSLGQVATDLDIAG